MLCHPHEAAVCLPKLNAQHAGKATLHFFGKQVWIGDEESESSSLAPLVLALQVEGPQLLRMTSDISQDALALLDTSGSVSIERTQVRSQRRYTFEDVRPAALDRGQGHKQRLRYRSIVRPFQRQFQQLLLSLLECKLSCNMMLKQSRPTESGSTRMVSKVASMS